MQIDPVLQQIERLLCMQILGLVKDPRAHAGDAPNIFYFSHDFMQVLAHVCVTDRFFDPLKTFGLALSKYLESVYFTCKLP